MMEVNGYRSVFTRLETQYDTAKEGETEMKVKRRLRETATFWLATAISVGETPALTELVSRLLVMIADGVRDSVTSIPKAY